MPIDVRRWRSSPACVWSPAVARAQHALPFTVTGSRRAYVPPATHFASSNTSAGPAPMGMRVRLEASYQVPAHFSTETRALFTAMQTHGMIVADNGSD